MESSLIQARSAAIQGALESLKGIERAQGLAPQSLQQMERVMVELAAKAELFPLSDFPLAPGQNGTIYGLAQDADHRYALFASIGVPGKARPPHNHTTWAIIAGVHGDEHNVCYARTDGGTGPGQGTLKKTGERTVRRGNAISFLPDDFHTIEVMGTEAALHLHMYGKSLQHMPNRVYFETPAGGTGKTFPPGKIIWCATAQDIKRMLHDGDEVAVLDVREEGIYAKRHLLLGVSAPLSQLELRVPLLVPRRTTRIALIDDNDGLAQRAAEKLLQYGYSDVRVVMGGVDAWAAAGYEIYSGVNVPSKAFGEFVEHQYNTPRMEPTEVKARLDRGEKIVIVDSRPLSEYKRVSIPGGIDCPGAELAYRVHDLVDSPDTLVVVNCAGRTRSIIGAQSLINAGIPNRVVALKNGTMGWHLAGFQVAKDQDLIASPPSADGIAKGKAVAARVAKRFGVLTIDVAQVKKFANEKDRTLYVFDVRSPEEYQAGHLPGTLSAPGGQLVQTTDSFVGVRNARIALVDDHGVRATMTAHWLIQMGWEQVFVVNGALDSAPLEKGAGPAEVLGLDAIQCDRIAPAALQKALTGGDVNVVDLDSKPKYADGHIPGAWHAIRANLAANLKKLPPAATLVLTSPDGVLATLAAPEAAQLTKAKVKVLAGGTAVWRKAGQALEQGETRLTDDSDDVWVRAHDRKENREQAMKDYLTWEVDLITQIGRDDDVHFRTFEPA